MKRLILFGIILIFGLAACGTSTTIVREVPTPAPKASPTARPAPSQTHVSQSSPAPGPTTSAPAQQVPPGMYAWPGGGYCNIPFSEQYYEQNGVPEVCQPSGSNASAGNPYTDAGFNDLNALEQSVADEQETGLNAASSSSFYYPGAGTDTVYVSCNYVKMNAYSCTATDSAGDTGGQDWVTPTSDGSSWSDTGMTWTGPDVTSGSYTVGAVNDWSTP